MRGRENEGGLDWDEIGDSGEGRIVIEGMRGTERDEEIFVYQDGGEDIKSKL